MAETFKERLKRIQKNMSDTAEAVSEKVKSTAPSRSGGGSGGTKTEPKKQETYSERIARIKKNRKTIVNEEYIASFQKDVSAYQSDVKSKYEGLTWQSASSETESLISRSNDLKGRSRMIQNYLSENRGNIDTETFIGMQKYLSEFDRFSSSAVTSFREASDFYGQFDTEDSYNSWKTEYDEYNRLVNLDVEETEKYLKQLNSDSQVYEQYERHGYKDAMAELDARYEGGVKQAEKEISKLTEDVALAKRYQNGAELAGVADSDPEFKKYSKYVSTVKDDAKWYEADRDELYEFINDKDFQNQYIVKNDHLMGGGGGNPLRDNYADRNYHFMNQEEIAIFNYYYATDGKDKAQEYLDSIQDSLNARAGAFIHAGVSGSEPLEFMFDMAANLDRFGENLADLPAYLSGDTEYKAPSDMQYAYGMLAQEREDDPALLRVAHDLVGTTAYMAPSILASTLASMIHPAAGSAVGQAMMGAAVAGNAYREKINLGYTSKQAQLYATTIGASEIVLGKILGGISKLGGNMAPEAFQKLISKVGHIDSALGQVALKLGTSIVSEGMEEGLQEILEPVLSNLILGTDESVDFAQVAYSALLGALSAGVLEGPSTVAGEYSVYKQGKELKEAGISAEKLAEFGQKLPADSVAHRLAEQIDENTGAYTIGRMFNEAGATLTEINKAEISKSLERKGVAPNDAKVMTDAMAAVVEGESFTDQQIAIMEANDDIAKTFVEVVLNPKSTVNQRTQTYHNLVPQTPDTAEVQTAAVNTDADPTQAAQISQELPQVAETEETVIPEAKVDSEGKYAAAHAVESPTQEAVPDAYEDSNMSLEDASKKYGAQAGAMLHTYKEGQDVRKYDAAYQMAYNMGKSGVSLSYAMHSDTTRYLSKTQRELAYSAGQAAAGNMAREKAAVNMQKAAGQTRWKKGSVKGDGVTISDLKATFNDTQNTAYKLLSTYAEATGVDMVLYKSEVGEDGRFIGAQGKYMHSDPGTIYIDINAGLSYGKDINDLAKYAMVRTFAHEFTHFVENWNPVQYNEFRKVVFETLTERGENVHDLIEGKQVQNPDLDYDAASREVVAEAMTDILPDANFVQKLAKDHKSIFTKLLEKLKEFAAKLRSYYNSIGHNRSREANALKEQVGDAVHYVDHIVKLFDNVAAQAVENYQMTVGPDLSPSQDGVVYNANGDPVAFITEEGSVQLSIRTYEEDGREAFRKYLEKCVKSNRLTKAEMEGMRDGIEQIYEVCKEFKDKYAPFGAWSDAAVTVDDKGKPVFSVVTPNGEYKMNLDFSLVCKKRRTLDAVFNEMAKRGIIDDFELGQKSVVKINEIIRKHGFETACALCFVDAKRFRQAAMADMFVDLYNDLVYSLVPESERGNIAHFNFSGNQSRAEVQGIQHMKNSELDFSHVNEVMKQYGKGTVEYKSAAYIKRSAEARKLLQRGDFMSSDGFDAVKTQNKTIMALYNSKKGTGGPKAAFGDVQYLNEVIKKAQWWTPEKAYSVGGVRIQSFSDYVPRMVFDYVQMMYDLAATKLPAHAYTKEAMFAKQFGLTGVKINMSLIPAIADDGIAPGLDANGNYVWAGESFDFEIAKQIQNAEGYTENCGTICVGVSYEHIRKLLSDPDIRMVIPYHKSGLNPIVAHMNRIAKFKDYTSNQNTLDKEGKKVEKDFDFNDALRSTGDPKAAIQQYFAWCSQNEYTPRFAEFAWHENYYKLIEDFTLYDMNQQYVPQREVRAVFPTEKSAFGSMKSLIESALEEDAIIEGKRDAALSSIVDEIQNTLPRTEDEIAETEVAQADRDLEAVQYSDRNYLDAVERGDMDTAQKMVDEVAKTAGYTAKGYHGSRTPGFTVVDKYSWLWFARDKEVAGGYGTYDDIDNTGKPHDKKGVYTMVYNLGNNLEIYAEGNSWGELPVTEDEYPGVYVDEYTGEITTNAMAEWAENNGYDSITFRDVDDGGYTTVDVIFNPNRDAKSADPVTYDDSGNVIPLSKRFQSDNQDIRYQQRTNTLTDREVLKMAANDLQSDWLTAAERDALKIFKDKLTKLEELQSKRTEQGKLYREQQFGQNRDRQAAAATLNRMRVLDDQIQAANDNVFDVASKSALRKVLQKARKVVEKEERAHGQQMLKRWRDRRNNTELMHQIRRVVNDLNRYLLNGNKEKHVPIQLQKVVAEALDAIDMDFGGYEIRIAEYRKKLDAELAKQHPDKTKLEELSGTLYRLQNSEHNYQESLAKLKSAYAEIKNSNDPIIAESYDEGVESRIEYVTSWLQGIPLRYASRDQLEAVHDLYKMILAKVRNANKTFAEGKSQNISSIASTVMTELDKTKKRKKTSSGYGRTASSFSWNNLKPIYAFERIGSSALTNLFKNVRKGEDVWATDMSEAKEFHAEKAAKYKYDSWDFKKRYTFASTSGMKFELTLDQIMSLYAYAKRGDQAKDHLKYGGFVHDPQTEVVVKTITGIKVKRNLEDATSYNISEETLNRIIGTLTAEQRGFVDEMQTYLSDVMGAKGNEVSLAMYEVKLFKEKNYFPLKSAPQYMEKAREAAQGDVKIKNKGFTKETAPRAKNPIVLSSFMDVWADHVNEMSMYHAFTLPLEDFYRVYNYRTPSNNPNLPTEGVNPFIVNAHGRAATQYIEQLLKDINGGAVSDPRETVAKNLMGKFKKAAVFSSLSVVIQQPSAIARAYAYINPIYFRPTRDRMNHKKLWAEVKKYAPVAAIKEMGYFDTGMGRSAREFLQDTGYDGLLAKAKAMIKDSAYRDEVLSILPALADEVTWCAIWNATKREVLHNHHNLNPRSEEFLKLVGERFTEVVTKTQVYDSVMARSAHMRSKGAFMNMWTSFMAEPTTSINMIEDALRRGNKKFAVRALASVGASVVLNSALVSLVYAARDDDEDETFAEKYLSSFVTEVIDGMNPLTYYPGIKDLWSALQGFDIERADMSLVTKVFDSLQQWAKVAWKDTEDMDEEELEAYNAELREAVWSVVDNISSLVGLPVKNIRRDYNAVFNLIDVVGKDIDGRETTAGSLIDNLTGTVKNAIPVWGWAPDEQKSDKLYDAMISGDTAYVERMKGGYKDEDAFNSAVRKALRDNDPRIRAAAEASLAGDPSERVRIAKEIIADGFDEQTVIKAINSEISALTPDEGPTASKLKGLYTVGDWATEIANGDTVSARVAKEDVIETHQLNGKTADEAEASFESSAKSELKKQFLDGNISGTKAVSALVDFCGMEREDAEQRVGEWDFEAEYGFTYSDRGDAYQSGAISAAELKHILIEDGGKTEEEADLQIQVYDWQQDVPGADDITASAIRDYNDHLAYSGVSKAQYYEAWKTYKDTDGDYDANGDSIPYSKVIKVMPYIDSLPLTSDQKTALALCWWAEGTVYKYKLW